MKPKIGEWWKDKNGRKVLLLVGGHANRLGNHQVFKCMTDTGSILNTVQVQNLKQYLGKNIDLTPPDEITQAVISTIPQTKSQVPVNAWPTPGSWPGIKK